MGRPAMVAPGSKIGWWRLPFVRGSILAAAAAAAYAWTFSVPLLFDDFGAIANNLSIRRWSSASSPPLNSTAAGRPVLNFSFAANYALSETAVWSYHLVNLAVHILAGLTLFGIVRRTVGAFEKEPKASDIAFFSALLWLLHPLQTESVTYLAQRAESLMGLFYLLTLYAFVRYAEGTGGSRAGGGAPGGRERRSSLWAVICLGCCLLGMATKEVMVSAPIVLLLYDREFLAGSFREAWSRRRRLYLGLGATWLLLAFLVLSSRNRGGSAGFGAAVAWSNYVLAQFPAVLRYLKLSFWPHPLVFYYGVESVGKLSTTAAGAAAVVALAAATAWSLLPWQARSRRALGFAGAWFFAILAPTCLVPIVRQTSAEHRMYLALVPIVVLTVFGIFRIARRGVAISACLSLAAVLATVTARRNRDYRSALVLWSDTVARCPNNAFARDNLAVELENTPGRTGDAIFQCEEALRFAPGDASARNNLGLAFEKIPGRLEDAIAQFREALRLDPRLSDADNNLAAALTQIPGREAEAEADYEQALRLNPNSVQARYNLANELAQLPGREAEAEAEYEEALRLKPDYAEAANNLGLVLARRPGSAAEAMDRFRQALRLSPDYAEAHYNLANELAKSPAEVAAAIGHYQDALRARPDFAEAHYNLANALAGIPGRLAEAIAHYEQALRLKPDFADGHYILAAALSRIPGRRADTIAEYERALRLKPDFPEAENNLANELKASGRLAEAISHYRAAVRLHPGFAPAHYNLAIALLALPNRSEEAAEHLESFLRLEPDNENARRLLARIKPSEPPGR